MSESLPGVPAHDCRQCRLGQLVQPCAPDDWRRLPQAGPSVRLYRNNVVQDEGPEYGCEIMLLGEAPGQQEDRVGAPFQSTTPAGRTLNAAIAEVGGLCRVIRDDMHHSGYRCITHGNGGWEHPLYCAYVVHCRPLDNKIDKFPDAVETCRSLYLEATIERINPKVIICLGKTAGVYWFGKTPTLSIRQLANGRVILNAPTPATVARGNVDMRPKLVEALRLAKELAYPL